MPGAIGQALESARQGDLEPLILIFILLIAIGVVYFCGFHRTRSEKINGQLCGDRVDKDIVHKRHICLSKLIWPGLFLQYLRVVYYCSPLR